MSTANYSIQPDLQAWSQYIAQCKKSQFLHKKLKEHLILASNGSNKQNILGMVYYKYKYKIWFGCIA